jgi:hypothetical protein
MPRLTSCENLRVKQHTQSYNEEPSVTYLFQPSCDVEKLGSDLPVNVPGIKYQDIDISHSMDG